MEQLLAKDAAAGEADRRVHGVSGRGGRRAVFVLCFGGKLRELFCRTYYSPRHYLYNWVGLHMNCGSYIG